MVVGLAGPIGSGKTSIALGIAEELKCSTLSFGGYIRDCAKLAGLKESRESLQELSEQLLASLGPHGLTRRIVESSKWDRQQSLVIDGIRHSSVLQALKAEVAPLPVVLVYLDVSPEIRRQRLAARANLDAEEHDLHSTERDVGTAVRGLADIVLTSDGEVKNTVEAVMVAIASHRCPGEGVIFHS